MALDEARVQFDDNNASVILRCRTSGSGLDNVLIDISCGEPGWQVSSIEQVCNSSFLPISKVEDLYIEHRYSELVWEDDDIENTLWLELFLPFTAVKNLYLSKEFAPSIAAALRLQIEELVGGIIAGALPSLQDIFMEAPDMEAPGPWWEPQENIEQFIAARQLSGHPITISGWDKNSDLESM
jgi:hypothetical protein